MTDESNWPAPTAGAPAFCRACGEQGTIHTWLNTETGEVTVECECGEAYPDVEPEPIYETLAVLGQSLVMEKGSWQASPD